MESPKVKNERSEDFKLGPVDRTISNYEWLHLGKDLFCRVLNPKSNLSKKGKKV
jgi:hypothetical protein